MLKAVSTDSSPCALPPEKRADGVVCSSRDTLAYLLAFEEKHAKKSGPTGGTKPSDASTASHPKPNAGADVEDSVRAAPSKVVARVAKKLGCDTEKCVVTDPRIVDFIGKEVSPAAVNRMHAETYARFKPSGPRNSTELLSNFDIDGVLQRWAGEDKFGAFFNCPFAMMDFEREEYLFDQVHMPEVLFGRVSQKIIPAGTARPTTVRRKCDMFACVLNTDVSTGAGKHWVCVTVDMRGEPTEASPWTVEYFNSAGNPPPRAATRWLAKTADSLIDHLSSKLKDSGDARSVSRLIRTVAVTSVTHQKSRTECGLYTLFYIRSRLEGNPISMFTRQRVHDREMTEFRRHVFSD